MPVLFILAFSLNFLYTFHGDTPLFSVWSFTLFAPFLLAKPSKDMFMFLVIVTSKQKGN
jgi:hypothetical protein